MTTPQPPSKTPPQPPPQPPGSSLTAGRLLIFVGPALALGLFTALLALVTALFGWNTQEMMVTAAVTGVPALAVAVALVFRLLDERNKAALALQRAQARVSGIIDSAMDAIITVDESQHVVQFNLAAEQVFGCPREDALGAPLTWFIPERFRAGHADHVRRFAGSGISSRRMGGSRVVTGLRRNGEEFPVDASISQISVGRAKLYTVILRDVTERVRAETALRRSQEDLRELAAASNSALEQEKSRIARELHDELAQALTALKMDLTWIGERLPAGQEGLAAKLAAAQAQIDGTVAATRRISADLRPLMLDDLGLVPAAEWLVQNFSQRSGIPCDLSVGDPEMVLTDLHATAIFRMLQESLTNVARHAEARRVEVSIDKTDEDVTLRVRDNGRGFSKLDPRKPGSFGLMGLRERASLLGGEATIDSQSGKGTTIEVCIPLAQEAQQT